MRKSSMTSLAAAGLILLVALSGCTPSGGMVAIDDDSESVSRFMNWDKANREYRKTVSAFPFELKNGDRFPQDMTKTGSTDENGDPVLYERGSGASQAYFFWMCSVEKDILDHAQSDPQQAQTSVAELRRVLDTDWYQAHVEDPDRRFANVLDAAELGDMSGLKQNFDAGACLTVLARQDS